MEQHFNAETTRAFTIFDNVEYANKWGSFLRKQNIEHSVLIVTGPHKTWTFYSKNVLLHALDMVVAFEELENGGKIKYGYRKHAKQNNAHTKIQQSKMASKGAKHGKQPGNCGVS